MAVQRAAKAVREASARAAAGDEAGACRLLDAEIKRMESASRAPVVREALDTLRTAKSELSGDETASRKAKMLYSRSRASSRQSTRRPPPESEDLSAGQA